MAMRTAIVILAAGAVAACTTHPPAPPPEPASLVVTSQCGGTRTKPDTVVSRVSTTHPAAGAAVRVVIAVGGRQVDDGPIKEMRYAFPVPAEVARITAVEFEEANPSTWQVSGRELVVRYVGPGGGSLVNDVRGVTIVAELSPGLASGTAVQWRAYTRFEHECVYAGTRTCTVPPPAPVLQTMRVR